MKQEEIKEFNICFKEWLEANKDKKIDERTLEEIKSHFKWFFYRGLKAKVGGKVMAGR